MFVQCSRGGQKTLVLLPGSDREGLFKENSASTEAGQYHCRFVLATKVTLGRSIFRPIWKAAKGELGSRSSERSVHILC